MSNAAQCQQHTFIAAYIMVNKIVIVGPESTGKSTLCEALAQHFHTSWCPEFAREYLMSNGKDYSFEDMYVMKVWCEYVFGKCHPFILDEIAKRSYQGYLLCAPDLPWVKDELREYPDEKNRIELYHIYQDLLIHQSTPWKIIKGNDEGRLAHAIAAVQEMIPVTQKA